jgi:transposase
MVIKMAYIEIKTINGKQYKYLRKTVRHGKKMEHISLKYLGPVEPIYKVGKNRNKSNASIYVRQLSEEEKAKVEAATKSTSSFTRDRAKIILLSSKGLFSRQIAERITCEERKVRLAIKAFNEKGLASLQRGKAKGAIPKFTDATKKVILMHFSQKPSKFNYHFTTWTLPRFRKHLIDYGVVESISIEKVRQILDDAGARLKRSKRWQYSPDKEFDKKNLQ